MALRKMALSEVFARYPGGLMIQCISARRAGYVTFEWNEALQR
jgi:hypothetical protein